MTIQVCFFATSLHVKMAIKDYYKILELQPNAGTEDVKRNFRRLALRFHPDTNGGNRHEEAWYREIQEAYQVLMNPARKSKYLQERWLLKSKGLAFAESYPLTPECIEMRFNAMCTIVNNMDHFRMDHAGLQNQLLQLCNSDVIDALNLYHEPETNRKIIHHLMHCMQPLGYNWIHVFRVPMENIARQQPGLQNDISRWFNLRKKQHWWDNKQGWIIGALSLAVCIGIAYLTRLSQG